MYVCKLYPSILILFVVVEVCGSIPIDPLQLFGMDHSSSWTRGEGNTEIKKILKIKIGQLEGVIWTIEYLIIHL